MSKALHGALALLLLAACDPGMQNESHQADLPRIAIAGLAIESSTFSPARTHEEAFHPRIGDEVLEIYPFLAPDSANRKRADWLPTLTGRALPGGTVTRDTCYRMAPHEDELESKHSGTTPGNG